MDVPGLLCTEFASSPLSICGISGSSDFTSVDVDLVLEDHLDALGFDWSFRGWD